MTLVIVIYYYIREKHFSKFHIIKIIYIYINLYKVIIIINQKISNETLNFKKGLETIIELFKIL